MKTIRPAVAILGIALGAGVLGACQGAADAVSETIVAAGPATDVAVDEAAATDDTSVDSVPQDHPDIAALPIEGLTPAEVDALLFMREEEKLARDIYMALGEMWGLRVFENISSSEIAHMDAVLELLDRYDVSDPALGPGEFTNPELQALYDELIALGSQSPVDALNVGATIEDVDIVDLETRINQTDNEDIRLVFSNLLAGSENHLRAFTRQLDRNGVDYEPQYMTPERYEEIIAASSRNA